MTVRTRRFGDFEVDFLTGELRKHGRRIRLPEQPFQLLKLLLGNPGELVPREELRQKLWPEEAIADFDHALNKAVNRLRETLADSATQPRFIETVPRRGYRFLARVEAPSQAVTGVRGPAGSTAPSRSRWRSPLLYLSAAGAGALTVAVVYLAGLRAEPVGAPTVERVMLAVLPFQNLSEESTRDFFSDGLTEEMIGHLGRLKPERLGVIARSSAMQYKGKEVGIHEIGEALGVDYVLEGTVREHERRVRVTARLVQVRDQTQLWAESYERDLADLLQVQSDVARRVARSLVLQLLPKDFPVLARASTMDAAAYESYLRGRFYWSKRTEEGIHKAIDYFEEALAADPGYALAYAGLAESYALLGEFAFVAPAEAFGKARSAALKALEIDTTLAEAHVSLGLVLEELDRDWPAAEREFQRAIELNPNYATAYHWYGFFLLVSGRHDEALGEMRKARELDPRSLMINADLGYFLGVAGHHREALELLQATLAMDDTFPVTHYMLAMVHRTKGDHRQAVSAFAKALALSDGDHPKYLVSLGESYAAAGLRSEAARVLAELKGLSKRRYVPTAYVQSLEREILAATP